MFRLNTLPKVLHIGLSYFVDLWVGGGKAREKSFFKYKHLIAFLFLSLFCPLSLSLSLSLWIVDGYYFSKQFLMVRQSSVNTNEAR